MKSEQVSVGVYDIASGKTVFLEADDFGREQYLTNVAWHPGSGSLYIQVLDRAQKHMHLNRYCARTGHLMKTLLTEQNEATYVEPQTPVVFLKNDPSRFIYRTNNRDGYFSLYLVDAESGKVLKRLTETDADVALAGQDGKTVYYTSAESAQWTTTSSAWTSSPARKPGSPRRGWHNISMSAGTAYFIDSYSSLRVRASSTWCGTTGKS